MPSKIAGVEDSFAHTTYQFLPYSCTCAGGTHCSAYINLTSKFNSKFNPVRKHKHDPSVGSSSSCHSLGISSWHLSLVQLSFNASHLTAYSKASGHLRWLISYPKGNMTAQCDDRGSCLLQCRHYIHEVTKSSVVGHLTNLMTAVNIHT